MARLTARVVPPQVLLPTELLVKSGVQLGVCQKGSAESRKMATDYLSAMRALQNEPPRGDGRSWAEVSFLRSSPLSAVKGRGGGGGGRRAD